ncbi:hypothetical protein R3P38DRAFT_2776790 [Favolaschia claudopus]|uniref:Uncharacterized protein n=1 Tax=Favolaschia claudopus TaxID=2862362 RepID=A0AAW0BN02_9AGAR
MVVTDASYNVEVTLAARGGIDPGSEASRESMKADPRRLQVLQAKGVQRETCIKTVKLSNSGEDAGGNGDLAVHSDLDVSIQQKRIHEEANSCRHPRKTGSGGEEGDARSNGKQVLETRGERVDDGDGLGGEAAKFAAMQKIARDAAEILASTSKSDGGEGGDYLVNDRMAAKRAHGGETVAVTATTRQATRARAEWSIRRGSYRVAPALDVRSDRRRPQENSCRKLDEYSIGFSSDSSLTCHSSDERTRPRQEDRMWKERAAKRARAVFNAQVEKRRIDVREAGEPAVKMWAAGALTLAWSWPA